MEEKSSAALPDEVLMNILLRSEISLATARRVSQSWYRVGNDWQVCKERIGKMNYDVNFRIFDSWSNKDWCEVHDKLVKYRKSSHPTYKILLEAQEHGDSRVVEFLSWQYKDILNEYEVSHPDLRDWTGEDWLIMYNALEFSRSIYRSDPLYLLRISAPELHMKINMKQRFFLVLQSDISQNQDLMEKMEINNRTNSDPIDKEERRVFIEKMRVYIAQMTEYSQIFDQSMIAVNAGDLKQLQLLWSRLEELAKRLGRRRLYRSSTERVLVHAAREKAVEMMRYIISRMDSEKRLDVLARVLVSVPRPEMMDVIGTRDLERMLIEATKRGDKILVELLAPRVGRR